MSGVKIAFTCLACGQRGTVPACSVTLVLDVKPRTVAVCGACGAVNDSEACDEQIALVRRYVRVVEIAEPELTPDVVLALVDQIRALPEARR